ncbi:MAG: YhbY family RNA-binding protein [Clostridia bacterium]|nr:YhbY family RNA-binding protein [Clostridia bacterium]
MTSKDRAYLKRIIACQQPVCQIGKDALSAACLEGISQALTAREVIKINVLQNCDESAKDLANQIAEKLGCDVVGVIGRKIIVYKFNPKNKTHALELK